MIVGTGNNGDRLRTGVRAEHGAGVEFCGRIDDIQRDQMYRSCRMLFYPFPGKKASGLARVEAASFEGPSLGVAGTVTAELFPTGMRAVIAKDLSKESIAEAAVPVLRSAQLARELGRAALARVNAVFLKEHFTINNRLRPSIGAVAFLKSVPGGFVATASCAPRLRRSWKSAFLRTS